MAVSGHFSGAKKKIEDWKNRLERAMRSAKEPDISQG
jgi:hypothetical protein